ncbi:hypothetical protein BC826DRAFT_1112031 [Russula brevipes]|nr:hypothetical protein BC826DRAFT_1112031 [Russula brevipes]
MPATDRSPSPGPVPPPISEESPSPPSMIIDAPIEELASPPPEPHTVLTHDPRATAPCRDKYPQHSLHPGSGEPTWIGGPGHNLDMCTAPLTAFPRPEVAITSEEDAVDRMFSPQSYFQNDTQQALWHLGDYGVAADAWRLFSIPQREQTLTERRLRVLKLEALAQVERQGYEEACDKAIEDTRSARARLHRAGHDHGDSNPIAMNDDGEKEPMLLASTASRQDTIAISAVNLIDFAIA